MEPLVNVIADEIESLVSESGDFVEWIDCHGVAELVIKRIEERATELGEDIRNGQGSGISKEASRIIVSNVLKS